MTLRKTLCRIMCNLSCRKAGLLCVGILFTMLIACYLMFFHHGPPEEIMEANRLSGSSRYVQKKLSRNLDEVETELEMELIKAQQYWDDFIKKNNFVSIGETYDNCDEKDRMMVGRTIMLPDVRWGGVKGVKSRTFLNFTIDSELTAGMFYLDVKYNGKDLYSRNWEFCSLDEDYDDRLIYCPFNPGDYHFVRDKKIPVYLPKGRYQTKGRITNQDGETVLCGFSDFSL